MRARARGWLTSSALSRVIRELGGPTPAIDTLDGLCAWSSSVLDMRRGVERREAQLLDLPSESLGALLDAAAPLGLVRTAPPIRSHYDAVIVLGGATTGNRLRSQLAFETLNAVGTGLVVALASDRPISQSELIDEPDSLADQVEWRNLVRQIDLNFSLVPHGHDHPTFKGSDQGFRTGSGIPVRVLVAPDQSNRRPTTVQQLLFLRDRIAPADRSSVLLITSAVYAPYQFFAGVPAVLADGADHAELIGTETAMTADPLRLAQRIGQELHAAIGAAVRLVDAPDS